MYTTVDAEDVYNMLRSDLRDNLGYCGIEAVLEYYEQLECDTGAPIEFDESLFYSWETGNTAVDILEEYNSDILEEIKEGLEEYEDAEEYAEELERACREEIEMRGTLLEMRGGGYLWQE